MNWFWLVALGCESGVSDGSVLLEAKGATDLDADGLPEDSDNCTEVANADQLDTDQDGFGNACDADFFQDGNVSLVDFGVFLRSMSVYEALADLDGDGAVNQTDFSYFLAMFGGPVGPSGLACADAEICLPDLNPYCSAPAIPDVPCVPSEVADDTAAETPVERDLGDLTLSTERLPFITAPVRKPVDTSGWTVIRYDGETTAAGVNDALAALEPETVLELPAGDYAGTLQVRQSEVVLRGDCDDISAVRFVTSGIPYNLVWGPATCAGGADDGQVCWGGDADCDSGVCDESTQGIVCNTGNLQLCGGDDGDNLLTVRSHPQDWIGGHARGSTEIELADASDYEAGDVVWLESAPLGESYESIQLDRFSYAARLVSKTGNTLTIDRPLHIDFDSASAVVTRWDKRLEHTGVECLTMESTTPDDPEGVYKLSIVSFTNAFESWVSDVDFGDTFNTFGGALESARILVLGSRFGNQWKAAVGDECDLSVPFEENPCWNKQTFNFMYTHDSSFLDNVVHSSIGLEYSSGSSGNYTAFNYFPEPDMHPPDEPRRALFPHGTYGHDNLAEHNVFWGVAEMDQTWGSQGPRYAFYRNVATGPQSRIGVEVWETSPDPLACSTVATIVGNHAGIYGNVIGGAIDAWSYDMWLERNVYTTSFATSATYGFDTTAVDNVTDASGWEGLHLPDTLHAELDAVPDFWCTNTVSRGGPFCDFAFAGGVGALWDGSCLLPAQDPDRCER